MVKNQAVMMEARKSQSSNTDNNRTGVFPMTVRFEHEPNKNGGHLVLTTRKGDLDTCEDEPIHAPGAIQSYGVLIAFDRVSPSGKLVVAQVSENSTMMLGITPTAFFHASCITELLEDSEADTLMESIEILDEREEEEEEKTEFAPYGFELSGSGPGSSSIITTSNPPPLHSPSSTSTSTTTSPPINSIPSPPRTWTAYAALHRPDKISNPERFILELELIDQSATPTGDFNTEENSTVSPKFATIPIPVKKEDEEEGVVNQSGDSVESEVEEEKGEGTIDADVVEASEEDLIESTVAIAIPLKEMVRLKRRREREITRRAQAGEGDGSIDAAGLRQRDDQVARDSHLHVVQLLGQVEDQLARATDLSTFHKITAGVFKELTEFDRAMIYEFDEKWNGSVIAEQVDYTKTKDLYRGLHFPASDIPAQARELYKINKVRLLYDRTQQTARMCCRSIEEVENPLDMSQSFLRAMSPIHLIYLANMGVRSTMSISIVVFGELWGLVALHHYGKEGHRVSFPIRALCRLLSESIGRNIERLLTAKRLALRNAINAGNTVAAPVGYILASGEDILALFKADFGFISIGGEVKMLGNIGESEPELLALMNYIDEKRTPDCISAIHINSECRDIKYSGEFKHVAGFLSVPLARRGKDFIVFCRRGQIEEIRWGGNPAKFAEGKQSLNPRNSFKAFSTTVVGKCRSWALEQQDNPTILLLTYGKFIDVWRSKEALLSTTRLANQLISDKDISKEVRTPLTSVVGYIDIALDGSLDSVSKAAISSTNSKSLVRVINDLLMASRDRLEGKFVTGEHPVSLSTLSLD